MGKTKGSVLAYCKSRKKGTFTVLILSVLFFIAAASVGYILFRKGSRAEPTLRFLSILHRHGERAPEITYPLDPFKDDESVWPDGLGQLTQQGKVTMFELGKFLRHRYDGFIPSKYKATEVSIISSVIDRCIMSAQLLLAGFFPPVGNQIWNADLLWQPIPVFSLPGACDNMIRVTKTCPLMSREEEYVRTNLIQKKLDENKEVLDYLSKNTGLKFNSMEDVSRLYDHFMIREQQGLKLPEWAREVYPEKIRELYMIHNLALFETPAMRKLHCGVFVNEIISNMKKKASGQLDRLLNFYSAHDTTIVRFWKGMNITQELTAKPNYGAVYIIELHDVDGKYRVKILYKDYAFSDKEMVVLTVRGCEDDQNLHQDGMCALDVFSSALQSVAIADFDKECQIP